MNQIKFITVDRDKVYTLIRENLYRCQTAFIEVEGAKYHHNIPYEKTSNAIKHGILSLKEEYLLRGEVLTPEQKIKFSREGGHINGIDEISLSSMDIDFDNLYRDERIFEPFSSYSVDILISSCIKAYRITEHYANEYLTANKISNEYFKAIDVRILKHLRNQYVKENIEQAINYYNCLQDIVSAMIELKLDIPLREMSDENITLDKTKILQLPKIKLK